jgi:hypothetical protein
MILLFIIPQVMILRCEMKIIYVCVISVILFFCIYKTICTQIMSFTYCNKSRCLCILHSKNIAADYSSKFEHKECVLVQL